MLKKSNKLSFLALAFGALALAACSDGGSSSPGTHTGGGTGGSGSQTDGGGDTSILPVAKYQIDDDLSQKFTGDSAGDFNSIMGKKYFGVDDDDVVSLQFTQTGSTIELTTSKYAIHFKTTDYAIPSASPRPTRQDVPAIDSNDRDALKALGNREVAYRGEFENFKKRIFAYQNAVTGEAMLNRISEIQEKDKVWLEKNHFYQRAQYKKITLKPQGKSFAVHYQPKTADLVVYKLQEVSDNGSDPQSILIKRITFADESLAFRTETTTMRLIAMDNLEKIDSAKALAYIENRTTNATDKLNLFTGSKWIATAKNNKEDGILSAAHGSPVSSSTTKFTCADYGFSAADNVGTVHKENTSLDLAYTAGVNATIFYKNSNDEVCTENDYSNSVQQKGDKSYSATFEKFVKHSGTFSETAI